MARRINLVPAEARARTTTNVAMLGFVAVAIIVLFALGLGYYMFSNSLNDREEELAEVRQETQALQSQVAALAKYDSLASDRTSAESAIQGIYAGRTLVSDFLNSLSLVVPENVWLADLQVSTVDPGLSSAGPDVSLDNAVSFSGSTYSFEDVAQLLVRLQLIPSLANVELQGAAGGQGGGAEGDVKSFSIQATLSPPIEEAVLPVSQVEVEGL